MRGIRRQEMRLWGDGTVMRVVRVVRGDRLVVGTVRVRVRVLDVVVGAIT